MVRFGLLALYLKSLMSCQQLAFAALILGKAITGLQAFAN